MGSGTPLVEEGMRHQTRDNVCVNSQWYAVGRGGHEASKHVTMLMFACDRRTSQVVTAGGVIFWEGRESILRQPLFIAWICRVTFVSGLNKSITTRCFWSVFSGGAVYPIYVCMCDV